MELTQSGQTRRPASPQIKTLLCDMGNVLVFFCHERMCRQIGQACGQPPTEIRRQLLDANLQWQFERGFLSEEQLKCRLEELFAVSIELPALQLACSDIFELNAGMIPVLKELKRRSIRLVLFSNTCVSHVNFIRSRWDFLDLFDDLILSFNVGAIKPEDRIFEEAIERIQCEPDECLYIDDIAAYVEKGRTFGLRGEVFTTTDHFVASLPRHDLHLTDA